jgi:hypothetical protein
MLARDDVGAVAMTSDRYPFDRVVVLAGGGQKSYSAEEFLALPLATRIQHILAREVEFFQGHVRLERADALKSLRR